MSIESAVLYFIPVYDESQRLVKERVYAIGNQIGEVFRIGTNWAYQENGVIRYACADLKKVHKFVERRRQIC